MVYLKPMSVINTSVLQFYQIYLMTWIEKKKYVSMESVEILNHEENHWLSLDINLIESFARNYPLNDKTNFALDCVILL